MHWEEEATLALKKLPVLTHEAVRKESEECATAKDQNSVTAADVEAAILCLRINDSDDPESINCSNTAAPEYYTDDTSIPVEQIERLETFSYEKGSLKTDYSILRVCSAFEGCPKHVMEIYSLRDRLSAKMEEKKLGEFLDRNFTDATFYHRRLRIAISGCPNSCSQPQISDFGIIAKAMPESSMESCTECGKCISACYENSIQIMDEEPVIDYITCLGCGDCARACPTGALIANRVGFTVKAGGRLGRHPQLAQELVHLASEDEAVLVFGACLDLYMGNAQPGERFTSLYNRLGCETFMQIIGEALASYRKRFYETRKKVYHAL